MVFSSAVGGALRAAGVLSRAQHHKTQRHLFGMGGIFMYEPPSGRLLLLSPRCEIEECRIYFIYVCCGGSSQGAETTLGVFLHFITAQECRCVFVLLLTQQRQRQLVYVCMVLRQLPLTVNIKQQS
jgi:hypothetical protein